MSPKPSATQRIADAVASSGKSVIELEHDRGIHEQFPWSGRYCTACHPEGVPERPAPQAEPEPEPPTRSTPTFDEGRERMLKGFQRVLDNQRRRPGNEEGEIVAARDETLAEDGGPLCETCKGFRVVRASVPLDHPDFGKALPCRAPVCRAWTAQRAIERLVGRVPPLMRDWRMNTFPAHNNRLRKMKQFGLDWLDAEGDPWMILLGSVGTCKSGLACALLFELVERGNSGTYVIVPELLAKIRDTYRTKESYVESEARILDSLESMDVLVLDEMGKENETDWVNEMLFRIVNARYNANKRTIVISNLTWQQLLDKFGQMGEAAYSRMQDKAEGDRWTLLTFGWPDVRRRVGPSTRLSVV